MLNDDEKKNLVPKGLKEEYQFAKTGPGPIETLTKHTVASLGDPLFVPQYLVMHSRQSILYREQKNYNDQCIY